MAGAGLALVTDNLGACWVSPDSTAATLEPSQHSQSRAGLWCPGTAQLMHNSWATGMSLLQGTAGGTAVPCHQSLCAATRTSVLPPEPLWCHQSLCAGHESFCAVTRTFVLSPVPLCCHYCLCAATRASLIPDQPHWCHSQQSAASQTQHFCCCDNCFPSQFIS